MLSASPKGRRQAHDVKVAASAWHDTATMTGTRIVGEDAGMMTALPLYDSHKIINTVAQAVRRGITTADPRDSIFTHSSMTEGLSQLHGAL